MKNCLITLLILGLYSCGPSYKRTERKVEGGVVKFDLQGHRGARGLAPENSIPGFWKALSLEVTTLELDLAVTADGQLILSHEPWFSHLFCKDSLGNPIEEDSAMSWNIYKMTYADVTSFDCGSTQHPYFPEQELVSSSKPRLVDLINSVEQYITQKGGIRVDYNIEIKSQPRGDDLFHPKPEVFSDLVYQTLDGLLNWERIVIQSFDFRVLKYFNERYPEVRLAALVENQNGVEANLESLGFTPEIYSCAHELLNKSEIDKLHELGMLVIPWTVNDITDMEKLYDWGVDGLITDYPNRFWESKIEKSDVFEYSD